MKKYIVLLIIMLFAFFLTGCSKKENDISDLENIINRGYIIVGVKSDSPPFGYYKNGKLVGIDVEIAKKIAESIFNDSSEKYIKFINVNGQNRISKLNSKEVDILVATMSINEKRKLVINFSKPYFTTDTKIIVNKNSPISRLQYFNSKGRLAVVMGTTGEKIAKTAVPNASLIGTKTYTEAINYLQNSQVDALLGDDIILSGFKNENLKIVNKAYSKEYYAVATRKSEKSKELLNKINSVISLMLDDKNTNLLKNEKTN